MPNKSCSRFTVLGRELSSAIFALQRISQRVVRSHEAFEYEYSAGFSTHSSNAIAIVEPKLDCTVILSSGPIKILLPSICEAKVTPSSVIWRSEAKENT